MSENNPASDRLGLNGCVALRIDYKKINPKCYICGGKSTVVRFTQATDGEIYVSALCDEHTKGEQQHLVDDGELQPVEGTGTFINTVLYEKLEGSSAMEELREVMEEATEGKDATT